MNIKAYIDYFNAISHLERDQQFLLLEQASKHASDKLKFFDFSTIAFLIRSLFLITFCGGSYLLFGYSAWLLVVSLLIGLILSRVAISEINTYLLSQSLKSIMAQTSQ